MNINLALLKKYKLMGELFSNHIAYFSNELYNLRTNQHLDPDSTPRLVIVARHHYFVDKTSYPSVTKKEVNAMLNLQVGVANSFVQNRIISNPQIDGFDVISTIYDSEVTNIAWNVFLVPETELISYEPCCIKAETLSGELFFISNGEKSFSCYRSAIMDSIEQFVLASGISLSKGKLEVLDTKGFSQKLLGILESISLTQLFSLGSFYQNSKINLQKLHLLYLAPLISVLVYLIGHYSLNSFKISSLEEDAKLLQGEAESVLNLRDELSSLNGRLSAYQKEFANVSVRHVDWRIIELVLKEGMEVKQFYGNAEYIELRGDADRASLILAVLNSAEFVESAEFTSPIRKSRSRDSFVVKIIRSKS